MGGRHECSGIADGQRRKFLETSMDVDFDKGWGLARGNGGGFNADALQLYEPNNAGLGGLQPAE